MNNTVKIQKELNFIERDNTTKIPLRTIRYHCTQVSEGFRKLSHYIKSKTGSKVPHDSRRSMSCLCTSLLILLH